MTEEELAAIIDKQIADAVDFDAAECAGTRAKALKYFEGDESLAGDAAPQTNRSRAVSRDMSDVHGWVMPSLLRVFLGSDRIVMYEPRRQKAEEGAKQATDYINYLFLSECDGYALLHDAIWEGLTLDKGIIKHWWDDAPEYRVESMTGIPEVEYIELVQDDDVEVLEHTEREQGPTQPDVADDQAMSPQQPQQPPMMNGGGAGMNGAGGMSAGGMMVNGNAAPFPGAAPQPGMQQPGMSSVPGVSLFGMPSLAPLMVHDLKIKRRVHNGRLRIVVIPQEEFRIDRNATRLDEEHVRFCAHVGLKTRSSLVSDGYKRATVDELAANTSGEIGTSENSARGSWKSNDTAPDKSTELVEVWECYVQLDYDGDGVAEWRRVVVAEGADSSKTHVILANEEWGDGIPFTALVPDPMPHRWRGGSLYDEIGDIQRIKTVFLRGINDNLYWTNNPQREVVEGAMTPAGMDELVSPTFGGSVMVRQANAIREMPIPFVADKLMMGLDLADRIREFRTGVSAATMSLDPEALQNQTATAVNTAKTASYSKVETMARNIAEYGGLKRLFKCLLRTVVQHQDEPRMIRLRGEWVEMNPRGWDADMDVVINVGLGSGSRDRDLAMLQTVAMKQELVVQSFGPMMAAQLGLGPDVIFETYRKMVEAAGLKSPESYFPEVKKEQIEAIAQQQAQQPDPKMAETQAKIEAMQQDMKAKAEARINELHFDMQQAVQKSQIDAEARHNEMVSQAAATVREITLKHQMERESMMLEHQRKIEEIQANAQLKLRELEIESELKREQMRTQPDTNTNIQEAQP